MLKLTSVYLDRHHLDHAAHRRGRLQQALHWANSPSKFLVVSRGRPPLVHKQKSFHLPPPRRKAWLSVEHRSVGRPSSLRSSNRKTLRRRADIHSQNIEQTRLLCQFKLWPELEKLRTARTNFGKIQTPTRQRRAVHSSGRRETRSTSQIALEATNARVRWNAQHRLMDRATWVDVPTNATYRYSCRC